MRKFYRRLRAKLGLYPEAYVARELDRRAQVYMSVRSAFLKGLSDPNKSSEEHAHVAAVLYRAAASFDELVAEELELVQALAPNLIGLTAGMGTAPALIVTGNPAAQAYAPPARSGVEA